MRRLTCLLLLVGLALASSSVLADDPAETTVKERKDYIPHRKYTAVPGTVLGVFATQTAPVLHNEGRFSAPDIYAFAADANSYRWVYVPSDNPDITNLQVPVLGNQTRIYPFLTMAKPTSVKHWGISAPYALVELQVNSGEGSPPNDSFVATHARQLDGTREYPLKVSDTIARLKKEQVDWLRSKSKDIEQGMKAAQEKSLPKQKASGPREQKDLMFVTWLQDSKELVVRFRTRISDGAFREIEGGGAVPVDPLPLPPRPVPPRQQQAQPPAPVAPALPPPPQRFRVKVGTTFGVEFGRAYIVNREGKLIRTEFLPFESFQETLAPPPGAGRPIRPFPLPPAPDVKRD